MPFYDYQCQKCEYTWDDLAGMTDPVPGQCPDCKKKNCIKKIPSIPAPGHVELDRHDLKKKLDSDVFQMKKELMSNENALANFVGEDKYQGNSVKETKIKDEVKSLGKIKKTKSGKSVN